MKGRIRNIIIGGVIALVLIQFFQPARNINYGQDLKLDFIRIYKVPKNIVNTLQNSCYDCHSNNTRYPWYSRIQPGAWFMANHIKEGKSELNFSEFGNYSKRKRKSKLKEMANQIKENEMPLTSYTLLHQNAILGNKQREELINWIENTIDKNSLKKQ
ncbi:MAG: heme-binding domain-containing protein [Flavobacterium sp.]